MLPMQAEHKLSDEPENILYLSTKFVDMNKYDRQHAYLQFGYDYTASQKFADLYISSAVDIESPHTEYPSLGFRICLRLK